MSYTAQWQYYWAVQYEKEDKRVTQSCNNASMGWSPFRDWNPTLAEMRRGAWWEQQKAHGPCLTGQRTTEPHIESGGDVQTSKQANWLAKRIWIAFLVSSPFPLILKKKKKRQTEKKTHANKLQPFWIPLMSGVHQSCPQEKPILAACLGWPTLAGYEKEHLDLVLASFWVQF